MVLKRELEICIKTEWVEVVRDLDSLQQLLHGSRFLLRT